MKSFKYYAPFILLLLAASSLFSQEKNVLAFSIGASVPIGSFTSTSIATSIAPGSPSATGTGLFGEACYKRNLKSHFSVGGLISFNTNGFKTNTVVEYYKTTYPGFQWSEENTDWLTIALMPGAGYEIPVSKKLSVTTGLFAGVASVHSPSYTLTGVSAVTSFEASAKAEQESEWAIAFTARFSAGAQLAVGKKTKLSIQAGYNHLQPTFGAIVQTYYQSTGTVGGPDQAILFTRRETSFKQNMPTINIAAGAAIAL
jgi:hypothetical protein